MCLGIPARITAGETGHPDLAAVDMGGVTRVVNIGLLDEPPQPGDWILVHMGFALSTMTAAEAADAMAALGAEREAEDREAAAREANGEAARRGPDDLQAMLDAVDREVAEREAARGAQ
jgi:hydrogenase expression/formation protein HypC